MERGHLSNVVIGAVVAKLGQRKELCPFVLPCIDVCSEVLLKYLVNSFSLKISLRAKGGVLVKIHAQLLHNCLTELGANRVPLSETMSLVRL